MISNGVDSEASCREPLTGSAARRKAETRRRFRCTSLGEKQEGLFPVIAGKSPLDLPFVVF